MLHGKGAHRLLKLTLKHVTQAVAMPPASTTPQSGTPGATASGSGQTVSAAAQAARPLKPLLGSAPTPANYPNFTAQDFFQSFVEAAEIGSNVSIIENWKSLPSYQSMNSMISIAKLYGLKTFLTLDPMSWDRTSPSIPADVGGTSFSSPDVRSAFIQQALAYAALKPDILGLGAEVNVLAITNPTEFNAYVSMVQDAYNTIKSVYPSQMIDISFQYDVMKADSTPAQFDLLSKLNGSLDLFAFTTYPKQTFGSASNIPADYYLSLQAQMQRQNLTKPIGFSEIGWDAANPGEEVEQNNFFQRLPNLVMGLNPSFLDIALLNDINNVYSPPNSSLNFVGIRYNDGTPKLAWATVANLTYT
jgi:hypothetical protein